LDLRVLPGDCREVLPTLPDCSVDAVVTDPPYGLADLPAELVIKALTAWLGGDRSHVPDGRGFMSQEWDKFVPPPAVWDECKRVLKPGGHLLVFAAPRTADLMGLSIRLAGLEVRDSLHWIYGSGFLPFPKSLDVSKAIDKAAGAQREVIGTRPSPRRKGTVDLEKWRYRDGEITDTAPATENAARWEGWGTALKPAHEPIVLARRPLAGTVAGNVLEHGTGGLNIDACRVGTDTVTTHSRGRNTAFPKRPGETAVEESGRVQRQDLVDMSPRIGRWPPNVLLGPEAAAELDRQSGDCRAAGLYRKGSRGVGTKNGAASIPIDGLTSATYDDSGGASRFFPVFKYQAKAPASERPRLPDGTAWPTVKPVDLMRWLVRLVTPPGGTVLDPFAGTGTTGEACLLEGFGCILIERDPVALQLTGQRLAKPLQTELGA
jgi:site-specific DNA-methyltransferase (adenine-specific)